MLAKRFPTCTRDFYPPTPTPPTAQFVQKGLKNAKNRGSHWRNESRWVMCQLSKGSDDLYEKMRFYDGKKEKKPKNQKTQPPPPATPRPIRGVTARQMRIPGAPTQPASPDINTKEWHLQTAVRQELIFAFADGKHSPSACSSSCGCAHQPAGRWVHKPPPESQSSDFMLHIPRQIFKGSGWLNSPLRVCSPLFAHPAVGLLRL